MRLLLALALAPLLLTGCGSVGKLKPESRAARQQISEHERAIVVDFTLALEVPAGEERSAERAREKLEKARRRFADEIAEKVRASGAFDAVERLAEAPEVVEADTLVIGGRIHRYDEGNIAARAATGFVGQAHFEATVEVRNAIGEPLATLRVDRNSWPLPIGSATTVVQTPGFFMVGAANKVASELAKARGVSGPAATPDAR